MPAPALVALAHGSVDPRTAFTIRELVTQVRTLRPDLQISEAFVNPASADEPAFDAVVDELAAQGVEEIVVVPLVLGGHADDATPTAISAALSRHPRLQIRASADLGLGPVLLQVLDQRLRAALQAARTRELDALVLAASGTNDPLILQAVQRLARLWSQHHKLPVVAAYSSHVPPAANEAVRSLRAQGRRHIAVGSLFLAPGEELDRVSELALEAGAVAVSGPLGAHLEIAHLVLARYAVGAVELVPF